MGPFQLQLCTEYVNVIEAKKGIYSIEHPLGVLSWPDFKAAMGNLQEGG